jgi:hypothetical protein
MHEHGIRGSPFFLNSFNFHNFDYGRRIHITFSSMNFQRKSPAIVLIFVFKKNQIHFKVCFWLYFGQVFDC